MIQQIDTKLKGMRVLNEMEFNDATNRGWTLIAVVQEKVFIPANSSLSCMGPVDGSFHCSHGVDYEKTRCTQMDYYNLPVEVYRTKYIVGRDEETVIGKMGADLEECQEEFKTLAQTNDCIQNELAKTTEESEKRLAAIMLRDDAVDKAAALMDEAKAEADTLRQSTSKMETDLAKVREHLGSAQFNEIVKEEDKT
jgi:hypothetical protein